MIYNFNNLFEFAFKILIILIVSFFAYKQKKTYKKWFFIVLLSPYIGGISFLVLDLLIRKNKITSKKEKEISYFLLKYEIYIIIVSFLVLGVILKFKDLI